VAVDGTPRGVSSLGRNVPMLASLRGLVGELGALGELCVAMPGVSGSAASTLDSGREGGKGTNSGSVGLGVPPWRVAGRSGTCSFGDGWSITMDSGRETRSAVGGFCDSVRDGASGSLGGVDDRGRESVVGIRADE